MPLRRCCTRDWIVMERGSTTTSSMGDSHLACIRQRTSAYVSIRQHTSIGETLTWPWIYKKSKKIHITRICVFLCFCLCVFFMFFKFDCSTLLQISDYTVTGAISLSLSLSHTHTHTSLAEDGSYRMHSSARTLLTSAKKKN